MYCPNCKNKFVCPCSACDPAGNVFLWTMTENGWRCNICGLDAAYDWWLDEEVRQLYTQTGMTNLTDVIKVLDGQLRENSISY